MKFPTLINFVLFSAICVIAQRFYKIWASLVLMTAKRRALCMGRIEVGYIADFFVILFIYVRAGQTSMTFKWIFCILQNHEVTG